ncbi:MBL fold metallo-hydrolase [Aeromonas veronii]
MKITQVRNATLLLDYAGTRFLIDPMLSAKGAFPGFEGTANSQLRNPLVELPLPIDELVDVDAVIVTHDHPDHWDDAARALIPKHLPLLVQHQKDADAIRASGFEDVRLLSDQPEFAGIRLQQTGGQHGSDPLMAVLGERMGEVCGVIFSHPDEQSLYLAGDAQVPGLGSIIMGKEDVAAVYQAAPQATLIASHMEAVNHAVLSRQELRDYLMDRGMTDRVRVPEDGEAISL